jgi:alkaline phosphatase D
MPSSRPSSIVAVETATRGVRPQRARAGESGDGDWYYRFRRVDSRAPSAALDVAPTGNTTSARFASASCQNYEHGFYVAHETSQPQRRFRRVPR